MQRQRTSCRRRERRSYWVARDTWGNCYSTCPSSSSLHLSSPSFRRIKWSPVHPISSNRMSKWLQQERRSSAPMESPMSISSNESESVARNDLSARLYRYFEDKVSDFTVPSTPHATRTEKAVIAANAISDSSSGVFQEPRERQWDRTYEFYFLFYMLYPHIFICDCVHWPYFSSSYHTTSSSRQFFNAIRRSANGV